MYTIYKDLAIEREKLLNLNFKNNKNILIFDIETTGFSREYASIYMIGYILKTDNKYKYGNIFASNLSKEEDLIRYFFNLLEDIDCIISYNGNNFDIPFLLARAKKHNISDKISTISSIDIYELLRPYRNSLKLEDLKLDTLQDSLGYKRQDSYNGGDLIQIYKNYSQKPYKPYYDLLLLHNREDVEGMINLLPLISLMDLIDRITGKADIEVTSINKGNKYIELSYIMPGKSPVDFNLSCRWSKSKLNFSKDSPILSFTLPVLKDCKKYFFENYRDYVYIPETQEIMHKSVASFLPANKRERVNKADCYLMKTGEFIPLFKPSKNIKIFRDNLKSKEQYASLEDDLNKGFYQNQVIAFLKLCIN